MLFDETAVCRGEDMWSAACDRERRRDRGQQQFVGGPRQSLVGGR